MGGDVDQRVLKNCIGHDGYGLPDKKPVNKDAKILCRVRNNLHSIRQGDTMGI